MKIVGIITEYNPFHKGHQYQIMRAKEICGADYVVAVMSGSFVQRGEPAICDKWARAKMALSCGVDLVIELPVVYSVQSAEHFAMGAVKILNAIGVDYISFGTEDDDINKLTKAARILCDEPDDFKKILSHALRSGISFPSAMEKAAKTLGIEGVISSPNNTLAVEYIKAMYKTSSKMIPIPIKRRGSQHDGIGSASYIRGMEFKHAGKFMPEMSYKIMKEEIEKGKAPVKIKTIESAVISKLRLISAEELACVSGVSEGLENRIKQAAAVCVSLEDIVDYVKTKRYIRSRIRRILVNALIGITDDDIQKEPQYIRVLGMNGGGKAVLKFIKESAKLPIIVKTSDAELSDMLKLDFMATDIYSLMYPDVEKRAGGLDLVTSPVVI